jgi:hypothetical protein
MAKLITTNSLYRRLMEVGMTPEQINEIFARQGWEIPTATAIGRRGRQARKPAIDELRAGHFRLTNSFVAKAQLVQILRDNYGVPEELLTQYCAYQPPVKVKAKAGRGGTVETSQPNDEEEEPLGEEPLEEEPIEEEEFASVF